jgi:hypothetical protein
MEDAMKSRIWIAMLAWLGQMCLAGPAAAQEVSAELEARAAQVVTLVGGGEHPAEMFAPEFLAQVPEPVVRSTSQQIVSLYGAAQGIARIEARSPTAAILHVDFERAVVRMNLAIEDEPPHRIRGLLVTGAEVRGQ